MALSRGLGKLVPQTSALFVCDVRECWEEWQQVAVDNQALFIALSIARLHSGSHMSQHRRFVRFVSSLTAVASRNFTNPLSISAVHLCRGAIQAHDSPHGRSHRYQQTHGAVGSTQGGLKTPAGHPGTPVGCLWLAPVPGVLFCFALLCCVALLCGCVA